MVTLRAKDVGPVAMSNEALGGSDHGSPPLGQAGVTGGSGVNTVGLLVRTTGRVTETGTGWFKIDDGSGVSLKVLGTLPQGTEPYVAVTCACSCEKVSGDVLRVIEATDIQVVPET